MYWFGYNQQAERFSKFYSNRNRFVIFPLTCLSHFHKMIIKVLKIFYKKQRPNIRRYWHFRNVYDELFMNDLESSISHEYCQNQFLEFESFKRKGDCILEKHAPLKKRYFKANQAPFKEKSIGKHIMKRRCLRNKFLNSKSDTDWKASNVQLNICVSLIGQAKKKFFSNLNTHDVSGNKTF